MNILPVPNVINDLPPIMTKDDRVSLDVELFGLNPKKLHRPAGRFGSLACTNNGTDVYIIYDENQVTEFLTRCQDAVWIFHNASFDVSHLRRWTKIEPRKRLWDTLLIEKIMYSGYYNNNEFGLNDLVRRYCDIYLEKTQQKQFNIDDEWTQEKIEYAAKDVVATWMIYWEQKKVIDEQSMEVYKQIDLPALWVTLGFMGVKVDTVKWIELANKNTGLAKEIGDDMDFNPRSPKQVVEALNNEGMDVISSSRRALERSDNETAQNVLKFRKFDKRANTYGEKWVEQFVEADGRVYASWQVAEAITGRMSCRAPNLQQIPVRETPKYRECFIAGEGNVFVIADWSAQEPRIAAYLSGDKKLMAIFNSNKDVYIEVAKEMFNETITKSDPRRAEIKEIVIGACNGLTEYGLSRKFDIPIEEAKEMFDRYFETFPALLNYREKIKNTRPQYVQTLCGRKTWLNHYAWGWDRTGMDSPIQGCIDGNTRILTKEFGVTTIQDIVDTSVNIWDGNKWSSCSIVYSGYKKQVNIEFTNGQTITCSPNHKFLTINTQGKKHWREIQSIIGWHRLWIDTQKEAEHWKCWSKIPDNFIGKAPNAHTESLNNLTDFECGTLIGRLASDGSINKNKGINILVAEHEKEILDYLINLVSKIAKPRVSKIERENKLPMYRIDLDHKALANFLIANKCKTNIPEFIWTSKEMLRGYLRGMFDGDGTVNPDGAILTFGKIHAHIEWAKEIVFALSLFGIRARINKCADRINVCIMKKDSPEFADKIGFISNIKQNKAENILFKTKTSSVYGKALAIKEIEYTDKEIRMFDVIDSKTGQFAANGFITHNSASDAMKLAMIEFTEKWGGNVIVLAIHDELVLEVPESMAKLAKQLLEETMVSVAERLHPGISAKVSISIGKSWADKK